MTKIHARTWRVLRFDDVIVRRLKKAMTRKIQILTVFLYHSANKNTGKGALVSLKMRLIAREFLTSLVILLIIGGLNASVPFR